MAVARAAVGNPGDEFTDVQPPQLSLVSASASSGTAMVTPASNTVTWSGAVAGGGTPGAATPVPALGWLGLLLTALGLLLSGWRSGMVQRR